ncbi:MAG TPA: GntR family transcriptional regulator, partial [Pseudomonadales bacterium]|nr:GntR family transcriptional regulator [Pseudomonadales bacterium]
MNDANQTRSFSVADRLREMILRGDFGPEARLQEIQLANLMDVSRTPIREALRMLAKEGLLNYAPNRGYQVRKFSLDDILAAFRVRAVLEGLGCRLIAEKGLSETLDQALKKSLALGD